MFQRILVMLVVGVPAITNVDEGMVLSISTLENWRSVPLRAKLSKIVDCLVIVENDTNLAAQGERYCGAAQAEETFILIHIGPNVGAGIVLGGQIYHGSQWSAGEIGYLRLPNTSRRRPTLEPARRHPRGHWHRASWRDPVRRPGGAVRLAVLPAPRRLDHLDRDRLGDEHFSARSSFDGPAGIHSHRQAEHR